MGNNVLYACIAFLLLLSPLVYAQYNCSDSERKCVGWRTSWSQENRVKIETPEYKVCMQKLERQNLIQQCLKELFECQETSDSLFYNCVRDKHNNDTCPCTVSSSSVSCTYTNGTVNCADCLAESEQVKICSKNSMEKYGWAGSEYSCNNSGGAGVASCDQWLEYNVSPSQEIKECTRYECSRAVFENMCINSGYVLVPNSEAYQYDTQMPVPCSGANHCFDEYGNLQPPAFTTNETCVDPTSKNPKTSPCGDKYSEACEKTNITKYVNVTYIFDRGYNTTVSESYTFEKQECYKVIQHLGGENCDEIINTSRSGSSIVSPEPVPVSMKTVQCSRCPSVCERKPPVGITCGGCVCPENKGFCDSLGERSSINDAPVYCINELLLSQKADNQTCQNNFECLSNFCSKGQCYDVRSNVENQANIIDRILNWIKRLFGLSV